MRHVIVWTLRRGKIKTPELLDDENERYVQQSVAREAAPFVRERDPDLSAREYNQEEVSRHAIRCSPESVKIDRMIELSRRTA